MVKKMTVEAQGHDTLESLWDFVKNLNTDEDIPVFVVFDSVSFCINRTKTFGDFFAAYEIAIGNVRASDGRAWETLLGQQFAVRGNRIEIHNPFSTEDETMRFEALATTHPISGSRGLVVSAETVAQKIAEIIRKAR